MTRADSPSHPSYISMATFLDQVSVDAMTSEWKGEQTYWLAVCVAAGRKMVSDIGVGRNWVVDSAASLVNASRNRSDS